MTESFEHDLSYLAQEGGDQWNESDSPFSCIFADPWSPVDEFSYDPFLESPSAPITPDLAASTSLGTLYEITDDQYEKGSTAGEGAAAADTPGLDLHDGMSDITSTIISTADEEQGSIAGPDDSLQIPTSYGKVSMGVKSSRGSPLKCKWKHCEYSGGFSQMGALLRHIKTKHISPGLYECPEGECRKSFNRKDNLTAHIRNVHRASV